MSLTMDESIEAISVDDIYSVIDENYVSKLLGYLRGDTKSVSSHSEYTKVYQMIIHHCDNKDNNAEVLESFNRFVTTYFESEVAPQLKGAKGNKLIAATVKVWQDFTIYAKMMDRCFDYLNRYHL